MRTLKHILSSIVVVSMMSISLTNSAWAECADPMAVNFADRMIDNISWTDVDGKWEGCATSTSALSCEILKTTNSCSYNSGVIRDDGIVGNDDSVIVTVTRDVNERYTATCLTLSESDQGSDSNCQGIPTIDFLATKGGQSANACIYTSGVDVVAMNAGFTGSNFFGAYICSDGEYEPIPQPFSPPAQTNADCIVEAGSTGYVDGVEIACPALNPGEERTIVVVTDQICDQSGANCFTPVGYGFLNNQSQIDFQNICICRNSNGNQTNVTETECQIPGDTDDGVAGEATCNVENAGPPVEFSVQNPRCATVAGSRSCYERTQ